MESGQSWVVPLSPYVFNPTKKQKIRITGENAVFATYNPAEHYVTLSPRPGWFGLDKVQLEITAGKTQSQLTLVTKVRQPNKVKFTFKPKSPTKKVYIAGDFNGWNSGSNLMDGPAPDGSFTLSLTLGGGRYGYKFV